MPHHLHLFLPRFHRKHHSRFTDVEGRRNITAPTQVRRMDDVLNEPSAHNFQRSDTLEEAKTYRLLPIFSGIMIAFSIMLSIPSLSGHWYIRTENNITIEIQPNTLLLDVALGFSMACVILASVFLVIRFAERCVKQMTLASIAFLTFHDLINIPVVTAFGVIHRIDDGFTYGQSFWFTVCATIVSTVTNITLIVDYATTNDFAKSGSGLTSKQRSLVIISMALLFYISLGSFVGAKLLDVPFLSALYFSVVSIESIGFGDIYPSSPGAKFYACVYIAGGILHIALAVTIARDVILESAAFEFQQRLKAQQQQRQLRSRWRAAVRWRLRERGLPTWIHHHRHRLPEHRPWYDCQRLFRIFDLSRFVYREEDDPAWKFQYGPGQKRLNIEALTEADWNAAALETGAPLSRLVPEELRVRRQASFDRPPGVPISNRPTIELGHGNAPPDSLTHFRLGGMLAILGNFAIASSRAEPGQDSSNPADTATPQLDAPNTTTDEKNQEEEWNSPRVAPHGVPLTLTATLHEDDYNTEANLERDAKQMFTARLGLAFSLFFVFWLAGSAIFMTTEKWTFWTAAYFCFISFTTVGYGDVSPKSPAGMSIFVVWALLGVATMTILVSVIMEGFSKRYRNVIRSASPASRQSLSENPTFTSGIDHGFMMHGSAYYSRGIRAVTAFPENGRSTPRIRIQESTPDRPVDLTPPAANSSQSLPIQLDHLKSLITMARAQCESESENSCHLESLISYLEKTLREVECPSTA